MMNLCLLKWLGAATVALERMIYSLIRWHAGLHRRVTNGSLCVAVMGSARSAEQFWKKAGQEDGGDLAEYYRRLAQDRKAAEKLSYDLGCLLALKGYSFVSGGCDGSPGAAAQGFRENRKSDAQVITGVRIGSLSFEQPANGHLDVVVYAWDFFVRLAMLVFWATGGVVITDGGVGSQLEAWVWLQMVQVTRWKVPIIFLSHQDSYRYIKDELEKLHERGLFDASQLRGWVHFVATPEEAIQILQDFRDQQRKRS